MSDESQPLTFEASAPELKLPEPQLPSSSDSTTTPIPKRQRKPKTEKQMEAFKKCQEKRKLLLQQRKELKQKELLVHKEIKKTSDYDTPSIDVPAIAAIKKKVASECDDEPYTPVKRTRTSIVPELQLPPLGENPRLLRQSNRLLEKMASWK